MGSPTALLQVLPLPLAQLLRRALNGKSPVERHNNAYYLAEATLKLAAAVRIGLWLGRGLEPRSPLAQKLEGLALPSVGHWRDYLRDVDAALAVRKDVSLLLMGDSLGRISSRRTADWDHVVGFAGVAATEGVVSKEVARSAGRDGLLGFFNVLCAYRNEVMGHGAQRRTSYYEESGALLLAALGEVLAVRDLFGGLELVHARMRMRDDTDPEHYWQRLTGLASLPLEGGPDATASVAGHLYFTDGGAAVPLFPLAVYREDDFGNEAVGLLNKTVRRTRRGQDVDEIRRADFLDYATGEVLTDIDTRAAIAALLSQLRGREVDPSDLAAVQDASVAAAGSDEIIEETISAGASIGDFELLDELGRGGMGIVYRARQRSLNRIVALKVLPPALATDAVMVARFRREVAALARADHPNVVKILTSGVDGDRYYYAMEYVAGTDLAALSGVLTRWRSTAGGRTAELREGHIPAAISTISKASSRSDAVATQPSVDSDGADSDPDIVPRIAKGRGLYPRMAELFADAALGLEHLHERGIVHRDVKPGNLMLTADGLRVVVMDLGLAHMADDGALTRSDVKILGTLRYMPPEQLVRKMGEIDRRADVYALGATLYELALARPIFDGDTEAVLVQQVLQQDPVPPRKVDAGIPRDLSTIITVATAKDAARRYQTAKALAEDLRAFAEGRAIAASPPSPLRAVRRVVRRHRSAVALAGVVVLVLAGFGIYRWDQRRIKTRDCANYAWRGQIVQCVGEVDSHTGRAATYRFRTRGGRVLRMDRVNGSGELADGWSGTARWEFEYDDDGKVRRQVDRNQRGKIQLVHVYSSDLGREELRDRHDAPMARKGSDATVILLEWDDAGRMRKLRYANLYGSPRHNEQKSNGHEVETDARGLITRWIALDPTGEPQPNSDGIASMTRTYDSLGNETGGAYLDATGRPVLFDGYASYSLHYDERGNQVEARYFDQHGKPVAGKDGFASWRSAYDDRGNRLSIDYLGVDGNPVQHREGHAGVRSRFDDRGDSIETIYVDLDGKPTVTSWGYAIWRGRYDESRNLIEQRLLDPEGTPMLGKNGWAMVRTRHDERGNATEWAFFDAQERPVIIPEGYAIQRDAFDARDNPVETSYYGPDGRPVLAKTGVAGFRQRHDERGHLIETIHVGLDGAPVALKEGYAIQRWAYDDRDNRTEVSYFDASGRPVTIAGGYSSIRYVHDDRGNAISEEYFGIDGRPVVHVSGYARVRRTYDERGNVIEFAYDDVAQQPTLHAEGHHLLRQRFDERNRLVEYSRFDAAGLPALGPEKCAVWRYTHDEYGNATGTSCHHVDGQLTRSERGWAQRRAVYDPRGLLLEVSYFDEYGEPVVDKDGFARMTARYDARGNRTEQAFFAPDGSRTIAEGASIIRMAYDARGNQVEVSYLDREQRPLEQREGHAVQRSEYDALGRLERVSYLGADGKPVTIESGESMRVSSYDARGNLIAETSLDTAAKPVITTRGYATVRMKYDERGNRIEWAHHGVDDELLLVGGVAIQRRRFDSRSDIVESSNHGVDGALVRGADGCAVRSIARNQRGQETETLCKGPDGAVLHGRRITYDAQGREIENANLGAEARPTALYEKGSATIRTTYDERGNRMKVEEIDAAGQRMSYWTAKYDARANQIERHFFDGGGRSRANEPAYRSVRTVYDARSKEIEKSYHDASGSLIEGSPGYARSRSAYDERGRLIESSYHGADGKPLLLTSWQGVFARVAYEYDDNGCRSAESYYGVDGAPIMSKGRAAVRFKYDERCEVLETVLLGIDGKPVLGEEGYAVVRHARDENGSTTRYFGVSGEPILNTEGHAASRTVREKGREVLREYLGIDGKPVRGPDGYSSRRRTYDGFGRMSEESLWCVDGTPCTSRKRRFARRTFTYDAHGRLLEQAFFDVDGRPTPNADGAAVVRWDHSERDWGASTAFGPDGKPLRKPR